MLYLLIFLTTFTLALFSTPFVIEKLIKLGIVDHPGGRKKHNGSIPRMGGIVIYTISVIAFFFYAPGNYSVRTIILFSLILLFTGMYDDIKGLKWSIKFILQGITAGGMVFVLSNYINKIQLFGLTFSQPFGYIILVFFIVGVINSLNLMDGMDNLVGGFSLIIFLIIFGLAFAVNNTVLLVLTVSLAGSTLGFSKYNRHPAKIFLGDTGSLILGFFLILSSILLTMNTGSGTLDLTFSLMLFGIPIVDTFKVMIVRILNKKSPFLPDRNHLHHVIFGNNVAHKTTVFIIHTFTVISIFTAIYYLKASHPIAEAGFVLFVLMMLFVKRLLIVLKGSLIHRTYIYFRRIAPQFIITFYSRFFVPVSILLLSILFFFLIPGKTAIKHQTMLLLIIGSVALFLIFLSQNFKSKLFNDVYVMVNVTVFLGITNLSHPLFASLNLNYDIIKNAVLIALSILVLLLLIFFMVRDKFFDIKVSFLTKYDFILLGVVSSVVILQDFIKYPQFYSLSGKFIVGFIAYMVYKVISHFDKELSRWFYYLTFVVTFITFMFMYVD